MSASSILVIGATGRTGVAVLQAAALSKYNPTIHAFARTPEKLNTEQRDACTSVVKGDATSTDDVATALESTQPTHIVVAVGTSEVVTSTDVREASAVALVAALKRVGRLYNVKVAVVSALGAGGSIINFGLGTGSLFMWMLRHALRDHDAQERCFVDAFSTDDDQRARLLILRPTGLTEARGRKRGVLVLGDERSPTWKIDRDVMATWLVHRICASEVSFGGFVDLTSKPR